MDYDYLYEIHNEYFPNIEYHIFLENLFTWFDINNIDIDALTKEELKKNIKEYCNLEMLCNIICG